VGDRAKGNSKAKSKALKPGVRPHEQPAPGLRSTQAGLVMGVGNFQRPRQVVLVSAGLARDTVTDSQKSA
jgi:hypothetical protein